MQVLLPVSTIGLYCGVAYEKIILALVSVASRFLVVLYS